MSPRRRSRVAQARNIAHRTEVLLGDVRAIQTGRVPQRVGNRIIGKIVGNALRGKWF